PSRGSIVTPNGSVCVPPRSQVRSTLTASAGDGSASDASRARQSTDAIRRMCPVKRLACLAGYASSTGVLIHHAVQPASTRAPVCVHVADHAIGGAYGEVVARRPALPPLRLHPPAAHDPDHREVTTTAMQQRQPALLP